MWAGVTVVALLAGFVGAGVAQAQNCDVGFRVTVDFDRVTGVVTITGDHKWTGGKTPDIFKQGAINNIKAFEQSLRSGKLLNNADQSAQTTLTTILGRTAAYEGRLVTWDEMMSKNERLEPNLKL